MARVLVRLKREHEVLQEGQRVTKPAGSLVEVSEHSLRAFADRMELVEQASSTAAADDHTDGQETTATGPQLVQDDDGAAEDQQSQEADAEESQDDAGEGAEQEGASPDSSGGNAVSSGGNDEAESPAEAEAEQQRPAYEIVQKPGGWYGIMVDGEEVTRVRKKDLSTTLADLGLVEE